MVVPTDEYAIQSVNWYKVEVYCADHWKAYNAVLPVGKLVQSKAETYTAEQTWRDLRHWFARFKRRGKVVSRCLDDLIHAIAIYFHRVNLRYEVTEKVSVGWDNEARATQ